MNRWTILKSSCNSNQVKRPILISLVGPTAVGKTKMAIELAQHFNTEIISADSRQFFQEISIGTAKPTLEEQALAKHHFIDNLSIKDEYNASFFEKDVLSFMHGFFKTKDILVMCGGSGLYVNAVIKGFDNDVPTADLELRKNLNHQYNLKGISYLQEQLKQLDPEFYEQVDLQNSKRLLRAIEIVKLTGKTNAEVRQGLDKSRDFDVIKIGLNIDRDKLYNKINKRVDLMMEEGLLDEIKRVIRYKDHNALKTVGYKELFMFLENKVSLEEAIDKIKVNSRRYAKRQLTWFKKEKDIEWFLSHDSTKIIEYIRKRINVDE